MKIKSHSTFFCSRKKLLLTILNSFILLCFTSVSGLPTNTKDSENKINEITQQLQLTGVVTDSNGQPLPGANILEKGTSNGVQADFDGNFSIKVSSQKSILVVSYMGFTSKEISINNQKSLTITLEESISTLDEVVVVGFGTQKASTVVSAVSQVTGEQLNVEKRPVTNGYSALIGAVPGLVLSNNNGSPGALPSISVRGTSSLNDNGMLVIIDNFEGSLADIDPQTIESVSVLKDASAVAIYGARGANGVLLVTTKRTGKDKKSSISYNFNSSIQTKPELPTTLNSLEYMEFQNKIVPGTWDQSALDLANSGFYPDTNWADELYENFALQQSHNLTFTGGSENTGYLMSASYLTQDGLAIGDDKYERLNLRLKIDTDITKWLSTGVNALISNTADTNVNSIGSVAVRGLPFFPVKTVDGLWVDNGTSNSETNHVANAASGSFNKSDTDRINLQLYAKLNPVKGLSLEERVSIIKTNSNARNWYNTYDRVALDPLDPDSYTNPDSVNRTYFDGSTEARSLTLTSFTSKTIRSLTSLTYELGKGKHNAKAFLAMQTETGENQTLQTGRESFLFDNIIALGQGQIINTSIGGLGNSETRAGNASTLSYFGRFNYSFDNKYLIEASFRRDGSSYFTKNNQFAFFPSVAVGWVASKEKFLSNVDFIQQLKFRASYGTAGSDGGLGSVTQQLVSFDATGYPIGGETAPRIFVSNFVNPNLVWETSTIFNIGVDASLFKGKLQFEADYFNNKRSDILALIQGTAYEYGFGDAQGNPYDVESWGWELNATHKNKIGNLSYKVSGNISNYDNKITRITEDALNPNFQVGQSVNDRYGLVTDGFFDSQDELDSYVATDGVTAINQSGVGGSYIGGYKYVDQLTIDTDGDGIMDAADGIINGDDRIIIDKNSDTNLNFGFNIGVSYKNLSLSARFYGTFDNNQYWNDNSVTQPFLGNSVPYSYQLDYWSPTNTNAIFPVPLDLSNQTYSTSIDRMIIDAEYIKLQNVTLNYDFDQKILSKLSFIKSMNIYLSMENLGVVWTNSPVFDEGWDPELGVSNVDYPLPFTTAIGLNVKF
ncbi:SusC/RagA family TonB-linked outer membrane protein [Mariniflexile sp. AS56]|uniref:SusC/RagA family TonB-linked outer membrane protein n=1 Tax=Mariniflexile sp. AS56 TaxID=3063957 RepID=UPI0026F0EFD1|nr:TonB-dependent receptor [Mariniflexile sp. AS56]MDO7172657.1 TonB-dependent receptor [Mariniflexile sp. AS56]